MGGQTTTPGGSQGARAAGVVIDIEGNSATSLATSTTVAKTAALAEGIYAVRPSVDTYFRVGPDPSALTTANGYLVPANTTQPILVRDQSKIGAILASATGTVVIHKISV